MAEHKHNQNPPPVQRLLTIRDLCAMLGVCQVTLTRWRAAGKFPPAIRFGRRCLRWRVEDVQEFLKNHPREETECKHENAQGIA